MLPPPLRDQRATAQPYGPELPGEPVTREPVAETPVPTIGILFVHGMGEQRQGDTLRRFGDPVLDWIARWRTSDYTMGPGTMEDGVLPVEQRRALPAGPPFIVSIERTVLRSADRQPEHFTPPHTEVLLNVPSLPGQRARWLMIEGWWADEFPPPSFSEVAKWALGIAPRLIVKHFELPPSRWWGLLQPLVFAWALLLVIAFQLAVILLLALAVVPFLKSRVKGLILGLIGSFGDVLVYISSPERATAIRSAVQRSLAWLHEQGCTQIAVVAHSLGTVVTYDILSADSRRVGLYATFGAALRKANVALHVQENAQRLSLGIVLGTAGIASFAVAAAIPFWPDESWRVSEWRGYVDAIWPRAAIIGCLLVPFARLALWQVPNPWWTKIIAPVFILLAGAIWWTWGRGDGEVNAQGAIGIALALTGLALFAVREILYRDAVHVGNAVSGAVIQPILVLAGGFLTVLARDAESYIPVMILTGVLLCWSAIKVPFGNDEPNDTPRLAIAPVDPPAPLVWMDVWASNDPVPRAPITGANIQASISREVTFRDNHFDSTDPTLWGKAFNRRSLFQDHSVYEENLEEFVAPLLHTLCGLTGVPLFDDVEAGHIARAQADRRDRTRHLPITSLVALGSAIAIPFALGTAALAELGAPLTPLTALLERVLGMSSLDAEPANALLGLFTPAPPENDPSVLETLLSSTVWGVVFALVLALLWYRLVTFQAWRQWDKAETHRMFRRYDPGSRLGTRVREGVFIATAYIVPIAMPGVLLLIGLYGWFWER